MKAQSPLPRPAESYSASRHGYLRPLLLGLVLSLAGLPLQVSAQEGGDGGPQGQAVEVGEPNQARIITTTRGSAVLIPQAQFQGSNLGEVIDYLASKTGANVMVSPEVKELPVPDVKVRNITGLGLLRAIADMGVPFLVNELDSETGGDPVWVLTPAMTMPEVQTNVTRIFNLSSVGYPANSDTSSPEAFRAVIKDLSDAINTALQAREEATKGKVHYPVLKVHEATRLMILSGNKQEVEIAQQVICALGGMPVN